MMGDCGPGVYPSMAKPDTVCDICESIVHWWLHEKAIESRFGHRNWLRAKWSIRGSHAVIGIQLHYLHLIMCTRVDMENMASSVMEQIPMN
jgi:hypothetical protein